MDLINGKIKPVYLKYLSAAFGSAMITSVYSIVDMAMVGQYQGPSGTAALAVVAPVWNIIYSLGLLMGISAPSAAGTGGKPRRKANTSRFLSSVPCCLPLWRGSASCSLRSPSCSFSVRTAACSPSRRPIWSRSMPC